MKGSSYRPVQRLGGTRADVWLGVVEGLNGFRRPVVLKRAPLTDPQGVADLFREAGIGSRARHPNVVGALDVFQDARELVLVLEHILGVDVRELARPVPWSVAARIIADAANGLAYVHELRDGHGRRLGIVHGDVSPSNLMVSEHGHTVVVDFGIARRAGDDQRSDVVHGTHGYLSPEQARGEPIDWRSDVFSLAMVFVQMMTPEGGFDQTYVGAASRAAQIEAPQTVKALLRRMLSVEAARRPRMSEAADLLDPVASQYGGDARAVARFLRAGSFEQLEERRQQLTAHIEVAAVDQLLPLTEHAEEVSVTRLDDLAEEPTEVDLGPSPHD